MANIDEIRESWAGAGFLLWGRQCGTTRKSKFSMLACFCKMLCRRYLRTILTCPQKRLSQVKMGKHAENARNMLCCNVLDIVR